MIKLCKTCGKEYETGKGNRKYCSDDCWRTERRIQCMYDFLKHREKRLLKMSLYAKSHPEMWTENCRSQRKKYPEKSKARRIIGDLHYQGKIFYPETCPLCGSSKVIHAHHPDYSKPKEIEFMCASCHKNLHKEIN